MRSLITFEQSYRNLGSRMLELAYHTLILAQFGHTEARLGYYQGHGLNMQFKVEKHFF